MTRTDRHHAIVVGNCFFDIVTAGDFGCVSFHQVPWHLREKARSLAPLFEAHGATYDYTVDHLNTGVMVFDPREHAGIFREARRCSAPADTLPFFDEPAISLAAKKSGRRQLLASSFNRCGVANLPDFRPEMTDHIWHLCGAKSPRVNAQIDDTIWRWPPRPRWSPPVITEPPASAVPPRSADRRALASMWSLASRSFR